MSKSFSAKVLSKQLRCPSGKHAKQIGENMFLSNSNMIFKTIDALQIQPNSFVLEIGMGNGQHLSYLLNKTQKIRYIGIDHSLEMIKEATKNNLDSVDKKLVQFLWVNSNEKPDFTNKSIDYCFTVNTIYFIETPQEYFKNIFRLLKLSGRLAIGFIPKDFAEKMAFTRQNFCLYTSDNVEKWLLDIGFSLVETFNLTEHTSSKDGKKINRPFCITVAQK